MIYNPRAGRRTHSRAILGIRAALGDAYELTVTPTAGPHHATRLAREAAAREDAVAFAWGGDGTVREVVEGILGSPVALGVLPGGTFNVVAVTLGLPRRDPVKAAAILAGAKAQARDVGLIGEAAFLMQATAGLDGFFMHHMSADLKAKFGIAGSIIDGFSALRRYEFPWFEVDVDGVTRRVTGAAFVNMAEYAGLYQFVPGARWDDRKAHALLYSGRSRLAAISFAISLGLGRHHLRRDVEIVEARSLTFRAGPRVFAQMDGDPWRGPLPVTCTLAADQIRVLIP